MAEETISEKRKRASDSRERVEKRCEHCGRRYLGLRKSLYCSPRCRIAEFRAAARAEARARA